MIIKSISQYFGVTKKQLRDEMVFNRLIWKDVGLYIDPFLFTNCKIEEFKNAREQILTYFRNVLALIKIWSPRTLKVAEDLLRFGELKWMWTGYGKETDDGNSVGKVLAERLRETAQEVVKIWIERPELFEIVWLFETDFWPDRLGDITAKILEESFVKYTHRVAKKLKIKTLKNYEIGWTVYKIPYVIETGKHVLFIPRNVLRELPTAQEKDNIIMAAYKNQSLRDKLNKLIGKDWATEINETSKKVIKPILMENLSSINDVIDSYIHKAKLPYDIDADRKGKISWHELWEQLAIDYPLTIDYTWNDLEALSDIVLKIIAQVKHIVENNWWAIHFYGENWKVLHERYFQGVFMMIAMSYCNGKNIDISPSSNAWSWPLDFKFSHWSDKIVVEIKKDTNDLIHGIETQLPAYIKSEWAQRGYFVIFKVKKKWQKIQEFEKHVKAKIATGHKLADYFIIDSVIQESASKRKPK